MPRGTINFILNGAQVALDDVRASATLLDYLRLNQRLVGSKEGCAEGDCGACTVLVGRIAHGQLKYEIVNACIRFLASVDGCHILTIEQLRSPEGGLHTVQQAMVDFHGSQCGFCTPGIVMALYALWMQTPAPSRAEVERALQGNLCRCTGYAPIIEAAMSLNGYDAAPEADPLAQERAEVLDRLSALQDGQRVVCGPEDDCAILPADGDDLAACLLEHEHYTIVSGATDVGLWVTKSLRQISPAIFIGHLDALRSIEDTEEQIVLGAGASYSECQDVLTQTFPHLGPYWDRIAGWQVRNMGTVGGNIANGSPIGDTPPVLIVLGASIVLRRGAKRRTLPLEDYFIDYGKQDLATGEFLESIVIPKPAQNTLHAAYKVSKRRDEDITSVAVGISVVRDGDRIVDCRIAYGGMAATPKRATSAEDRLTGAAWSETSFDAAAEAVAADFKPLNDMRASSEYRMLVAQNLLRRFFLEHDSASGAATSLDAA